MRAGERASARIQQQQRDMPGDRMPALVACQTLRACRSRPSTLGAPFLPPAVAHILQQGDMYGEGESPIRPEQMTSEVGPLEILKF